MATHFHQDVFYCPLPINILCFFRHQDTHICSLLHKSGGCSYWNIFCPVPAAWFQRSIGEQSWIVSLKKDLLSSLIKPKHHKMSIFQIGIVLCTCCALLALLCVVKFAVYFSSPEQRAKVLIMNIIANPTILTGWQNLAAFRQRQKWPWKFSSSAYLQFSRQMRRFCA